MNTPELVKNFFRHEYSRLVAILSCRVGVQYTEDAEDAVQSALMTALNVWGVSGQPDNPTAWLYRVAHNNLMGEFRQRTGRNRILEKYVLEDIDVPEIFLEGEVRDDLLRMLFVCCDEAIPQASQLVLALKILCGFDVREISIRLFTSEANVYKRLTRARKRLGELPFCPRELSDEQYVSRLSSVHSILYQVFTEGYLSSHAEMPIRRELCEEAIRLNTILVGHRLGQTPESFALLALMHLHTARMTARQDDSGGLLLLEEQHRKLWDYQRIQVGLKWLEKSAQGDVFSRYHAEAGIASEHCLAPSFQETRWDKVDEYYSMLERIAPFSIHKLNRAVAIAEWKGPDAGLSTLKDFAPPNWLVGSYMWSAVLSDLHYRCRNFKEAKCYRDVALKSAPTPAVKELLLRRFNNQAQDCPTSQSASHNSGQPSAPASA